MNNQPPNQAFGPTINRLGDVMEHINWLSQWGASRLAKDLGVSASAVTRVMNGTRNPSYLMVARITTGIERYLGIRVDPRDLFAENGQFLTRFTCDLVGCRGCLPNAATDEFGDRKQSFVGVETGKWVMSRYPHGFEGDGRVR